MPFKLRFGKEPTNNVTHLVEDTSINGFKVLNYNKKEELFHVIGKTATTRGQYRFRRVADGDNVALGSVVRQQLKNEYKLLGTLDEKIGKVKITEEGITVTVSDTVYLGKIDNRAQNFSFIDQATNKMCLTIDKKIVSLKDAYEISGVENFPFLIAQMIGVVIDDYFHSGK